MFKHHIYFKIKDVIIATIHCQTNSCTCRKVEQTVPSAVKSAQDLAVITGDHTRQLATGHWPLCDSVSCQPLLA